MKPKHKITIELQIYDNRNPMKIIRECLNKQNTKFIVIKKNDKPTRDIQIYPKPKVLKK